MEKLDQFIALRALMREVVLNGSTVTGMVTVDPRVTELVDSLTGEGFTIKKNGLVTTPETLKSGEVAHVAIEEGVFNYYESFDHFLKHFPAEYPVPRFRINELNYTSSDTTVPEAFRRYRDVLRLWALLNKISDHIDDRRIFLLSSDKVEIECAYVSADLVSLEKLDQLEADFADNAACRSEKRTLFKRALQEDLASCLPNQRLGHLLRNFRSIYDRYWQNYRLFLEGISFEKIFESYVEKHSKLITEFNSVLGGIQTALIGLPIASFVILEKMTVANQLTFKNSILLVGCLVFSGFLAILSFSQGRTLAASKELADELKDEVTTKNPDLAKKLAPSLQRLTRQAQWVTRLLITVRLLLGGLVFASILTYSYVGCVSFRTWLNGILQSYSP